MMNKLALDFCRNDVEKFMTQDTTFQLMQSTSPGVNKASKSEIIKVLIHGCSLC